MKCSLCEGDTEKFKYCRKREYIKCKNCQSVMLDSDYYISLEKEKERYKKHNNDVNDKKYQAFVSPIVDSILNDYDKNHRGLDFGAGTGPVITKLLRDKGYGIQIYDPFFANDKKKLEEKYDYIVCCEVVEHFHNPKKEFKKLKYMLKQGGSLYIMTSIYKDGIDFESWNYKNDSTHVFFYHKKALEYIKKVYGFSEMIIKKDMIIYKNIDTNAYDKDYINKN